MKLDAHQLAILIHEATIHIRDEYLELREGKASGGPRIEFWNELIHRAAGFLMNDREPPESFLDEHRELAHRAGVTNFDRVDRLFSGGAGGL